MLFRSALRSALARVAAADREVAAAIAEMLPTIRLSASGGFQGTNVNGLTDDLIWSITGGLVQPLFDADRRGSEVDRSKAVLQERVVFLDERFIVALREVEDALVRERNQRDLLDRVRGQVDTARKTLVESELLFVNGQVEYLDVITTLQTLQRLQRQEITVRQALLANRAALHLALGGDWTRDLEPPSSEDEHPQDHEA